LGWLRISVTTRLNLPYIILFGPYHPHGFVPSDASPLLSLTPQNTYDKSATITLNKVSYHSLIRQYKILQSTPLKEPDDHVGTTRQLVRSVLIPTITARPNLPYIVCFGPYRPHGFVPGDASPFLSLMPKNAYDKSATNTFNKASYHSFTRRCRILQLDFVICFDLLFIGLSRSYDLNRKFDKLTRVVF
jgi:hypothetical protein